jgi:hypothetical protein
MSRSQSEWAYPEFDQSTFTSCQEVTRHELDGCEQVHVVLFNLCGLSQMGKCVFNRRKVQQKN